jgi:3-oxocholest-4-en-26-oyl-CoA dehydrogenase alpha subunit
MFLEYTAEQQELSRQLRAYFAKLMTPQVREAIAQDSRPAYREVVRRLGRDGWLGLGWPAEYGGQDRPLTDQYILFDEVQRAGVPFPFVTINTIGPVIQRFGSDEQRRQYLPGILAGEIIFAIGYTEPEAGTDLASLKTRADLQMNGEGEGATGGGAEWVINGSKVFTSGAGHSDFIWLACRTDPAAPRRRGLSILIVPTSSDGFAWTPIRTPGQVYTAATYYDNVRIPRGNIIGEPGDGWAIITSQLRHERVGLAAYGGRTEQLWEDLAGWCRGQLAADGTRLADQPWVRRDLARTYAQLAAMRLLNWKLAAGGQEPSPASAAVAKVFGTETQDAVCHALLGAAGPLATRRPGSPGAPLDGRLELLARGSFINTFGGGTNEVLRDMIATDGLGMAHKSRRTT